MHMHTHRYMDGRADVSPRRTGATETGASAKPPNSRTAAFGIFSIAAAAAAAALPLELIDVF